MGVAYFIVLDNSDPGFDPYVCGKAIAREGTRLARVAKSLGLRELDEYVSGDEDAAGLAAEFGLDEDIQAPAEQWFDPDEGLQWVASVRDHLQATPRRPSETSKLS